MPLMRLRPVLSHPPVGSTAAPRKVVSLRSLKQQVMEYRRTWSDLAFSLPQPAMASVTFTQRRVGLG
jgi:hypothetical protein